ncbi:UNVERIFIED_CONTAM: adenosylcobyric acid synthase (glutamine-hydrolysing) [Acetivibrio alkalicellulosi]
MAKVIMIQGTTSNAGKSIITAGLCRIFAQDGYKVAPFKSQNMALNSFITEDGYEMGRAQVVQAEAAYKKPDIRMNPILLKPTSDQGSQVIVNGEVVGNMSAADYYKNKPNLIPHVLNAFNSLAKENDIIVIEGAGSPAEINLKENDIVNMGMAKMVKAPVLVVGDIDRGGVFAALYGTYMLQSEEDKKYIKGNIINKFRGDVNILKPGLLMLENLINIPTIGVIPYMHLNIDDEDSLSDVFAHKTSNENIDIVVIKLPRISNFTDFNAFEIVLDTKVRYVSCAQELKNPDLVIIPGTKNTLGDLKWLKESGLEAEILKYASKGNPVFGICGGYQMLCKSLNDPYSVEDGGEMAGLGLIDGETIFEKEKIRTRVKGTFKDVKGIFNGLTGKSFEGYEIHMGTTKGQKTMSDLATLVTIDNKVKSDGLCNQNVYGTYVHGIFDSEEVLNEIARAILNNKGIDFEKKQSFDIETYKQQQYDKLSEELRRSLDMDYIYKILNEGCR